MLLCHRFLQARTETLRNKFESGLRDARESQLSVPDCFSCSALTRLLRYAYCDSCGLEEDGLDMEPHSGDGNAPGPSASGGGSVEAADKEDLAVADVLELLEVAAYYGVPRYYNRGT